MTDPTLTNLIQHFNNENLSRFMQWKSRDFSPTKERLDQITEEGFDEINKVGEIHFPNKDQLLVCSIKVTKNLTERSGKKAQFDLAKKILKDYGNLYDGIFVFHDAEGNFRFSLIYANYFGTRKEFSNYRRFTYYVSVAQTNKTFIQRMAEGDFANLEGIKDAFSVEKVTKEFYQDISNWFDWALRVAEFPADAIKKENGKEMSVIRLITRMIFIWFMRIKGFISHDLFDKETIKWLVTKIDDPDSSSYFHAILQNLFFATLSKEVSQRQLRADPGFKNIQRDYGKPEIFRFKNLFFDQGTINKLFTDVPFLNGGLFTCLDIRKDPSKDITEEVFIDGFSDNPKNQAKIPNRLFFGHDTSLDLNEEHGTANKVYTARGLLKTFERYNFTIDENTPDDQDVALDPELLGQVFENLLARVNPETSVAARKETGSFYTPREIVDFMVDESLLAFFQSYLQGVTSESDDLEYRLRKLISYHGEPPTFSDSERTELIRAIDQIKVLDPAVGSGAFPMGMLNKLVYILGQLDPNNTEWKNLQYENAIKAIDSASQSNKDEQARVQRMKEIEKAFDRRVDSDYGRKLYIIRNSIYGVDIQPMAIHIAKLRFFISLIVEQKMEKDKLEENFGILPLPNLETKLVAANSLLHLYNKPYSIIPKPKVEITEEIQKDIDDIIRKFEILQDTTIPYIRDRIRKEALDLSFKLNHALRSDPDYTPIDVPRAYETAKSVMQLKEFLPSYETKPYQPSFIDNDTEGLKQKLAQIHEQHFNASNREEKEKLEQQDRQVREELQKVISSQKSTWGGTTDKKSILLSTWDPFDQNSVAEFFDPEWMFDVKDGFDIVIGNPPYIQLQNFASRNSALQWAYANSGYQTHNSSGDIYCLFYEMGYSVLKWRTGILAYITSNKWMRAGYGFQLRKFFKNNIDTILLIDFAGQRVFTTATVDVNIVIFRKSSTNRPAKACTIEENCLHALSDYIKQNSLITTFDSGEAWVILNLIEKGIKEKIELLGTPLSRWGIEINYGIKTGLNEAFIIDGIMREELIYRNPNSDEILKPILRGRDIKRYKYEFADLWLINAHNGVTGRLPRIEMDNYPAVRAHLLQYFDDLYDRSDRGDTIFNLRSCAYIEEFEKPKIMWAELARTGNSFILDNYGYYGLAGTFILTLNPNELAKISYEYLVSILNNPLTLISLEHVYSKLDDTGWQWKKAPFLKIPIPRADYETQSKMTALYHDVINSNASIEAISELDREIFRFYALTSKEITFLFKKLKVFRDEERHFL